MPPDAPGHALGVRFDGPLPALVPGGDGLPACAVELLVAEEVERGWQPGDVLFERRATDGSVLLSIERGPAGTRVWGHGHGVCTIAPDGRSLRAAPPDGPAWLRPRLLIAQTLPLVAALHGRELLHASAVALDGRVLALTAASGTGKSSVALHLGGAFVTDDVVALDDALRVHPGPRFANAHDHELAQLPAAARPLELGRSDKVHVAPQGATGPLPLGAVVVLDRAEPAGLHPLDDPPAALLAASYLPHATDPVRLLGTAAAVAASVPLARFGIGPGDRAPAVAQQLRAWALRTWRVG